MRAGLRLLTRVSSVTSLRNSSAPPVPRVSLAATFSSSPTPTVTPHADTTPLSSPPMHRRPATQDFLQDVDGSLPRTSCGPVPQPAQSLFFPPQSHPPPNHSLSSPESLTNPIPPGSAPSSSFDLFDELEWPWASSSPPGAMFHQHQPMAHQQAPMDDRRLLYASSPPIESPIYPTSDPSYTPMSTQSSLPYPDTPISMSTDFSPHHPQAPFQSYPLSSSLPANVPSVLHPQSPPLPYPLTLKYSGPSDADGTPHSYSHARSAHNQWFESSTVVSRPPLRQVHTTFDSDATSRIGAQRTPRSSIGSRHPFHSPQSPRSHSSLIPPGNHRRMASFPDGGDFVHVRYSSSSSGHADSSPPAVPPSRSGAQSPVDAGTDSNDDPTKKKRKREEKDKSQGLKRSALSPPKVAPSTWQIYFTDHLQRHRELHPEQKMNVAQLAKELALEYKHLSDVELEPYRRRAQQAKAERDRQMAAWERTLTPDDVRAENQFRAAQRKDGKSRKANMKDPNAPKKPLSAYFMFLAHVRSSPEMVSEVFGEETGTTRQSVLAAGKWRNMTDDEKKPFLLRAEQEKLAYEAARREYEGSFNPDSANLNGGNGESTLDWSSGHFSIDQLSAGTSTLVINNTPSVPKSKPRHHHSLLGVDRGTAHRSVAPAAPIRQQFTRDDEMEAIMTLNEERFQIVPSQPLTAKKAA